MQTLTAVQRILLDTAAMLRRSLARARPLRPDAPPDRLTAPDAHEAAATSRIDVLDGWRGLAVLALLIGHFVPLVGLDAPRWSANLGRVGVELFFALSGALMGGILFARRQALGAFAVRRVARIVPSLWVFLAVTGAWLVFGRHGSEALGPVLSSAAGLLNFYPRTTGEMPPAALAHLWSVAVELQGYVVLGLVAWVCRRTGWSPLALLGPLVIAGWMMCAQDAALSVPRDYYQVYWLPEVRMGAILLAAALVAGVAEGLFTLERLPPWPAMLCAGVLLQFNAVPDPLKYSIGSAVLAIACAQLATLRADAPLRAPRLTRALANRGLTALGAASYSIYLWQQLFYARKWMMPWPVALALALAAGFAAHYLFDRKLHRSSLRWLDARLRSCATQAS